MPTHKITSDAILDNIGRHIVHWYNQVWNGEENLNYYLDQRFKEDYSGHYELVQRYNVNLDHYEYYLNFPTTSDEIWFMLKHYD